MKVLEVKALGLRQKVGELRGKVQLNRSVSSVVTVNGSDCELKEVWISDGMVEIKVTLWETFVNLAEGGNSYAFKNLSTRERDGCICLCTGPSSTIEQIADLVVEETEGSEEENSTALFSATIKGIEVVIHRKCSSCQFKQKEFVEKSATHRCEGCKLKQASLCFSTSFGGKLAVSTDSGDQSVLLTSSALSSYLRGAGLTSLFNDAEAIEDYFLQFPAFNLRVNLDGFLMSIEAARKVGSSEAAAPAVGVEELWDSVTEEVGVQVSEEGNTVSAGSEA